MVTKNRNDVVCDAGGSEGAMPDQAVFANTWLVESIKASLKRLKVDDTLTDQEAVEEEIDRIAAILSSEQHDDELSSCA